MEFGGSLDLEPIPITFFGGSSMSDDPARQPTVTFYTYDAKDRLIDLRHREGEAAPAEPGAPEDSTEFAFEHDAAHRVFRLTAPDGSMEVFRDNPMRYLCVAPDAETGAMRPVMKRGRPVYLHLAGTRKGGHRTRKGGHSDLTWES
jgi:hypothetical protein